MRKNQKQKQKKTFDDVVVTSSEESMDTKTFSEKRRSPKSKGSSSPGSSTDSSPSHQRTRLDQKTSPGKEDEYQKLPPELISLERILHVHKQIFFFIHHLGIYAEHFDKEQIEKEEMGLQKYEKVVSSFIKDENIKKRKGYLKGINGLLQELRNYDPLKFRKEIEILLKINRKEYSPEVDRRILELKKYCRGAFLATKTKNEYITERDVSKDKISAHLSDMVTTADKLRRYNQVLETVADQEITAIGTTGSPGPKRKELKKIDLQKMRQPYRDIDAVALDSHQTSLHDKASRGLYYIQSLKKDLEIDTLDQTIIDEENKQGARSDEEVLFEKIASLLKFISLNREMIEPKFLDEWVSACENYLEPFNIVLKRDKYKDLFATIDDLAVASEHNTEDLPIGTFLSHKLCKEMCDINKNLEAIIPSRRPTSLEAEVTPVKRDSRLLGSKINLITNVQLKLRHLRECLTVLPELKRYARERLHDYQQEARQASNPSWFRRVINNIRKHPYRTLGICALILVAGALTGGIGLGVGLFATAVGAGIIGATAAPLVATSAVIATHKKKKMFDRDEVLRVNEQGINDFNAIKKLNADINMKHPRSFLGIIKRSEKRRGHNAEASHGLPRSQSFQHLPLHGQVPKPMKSVVEPGSRHPIRPERGKMVEQTLGDASQFSLMHSTSEGHIDYDHDLNTDSLFHHPHPHTPHFHPHLEDAKDDQFTVSQTGKASVRDMLDQHDPFDEECFGEDRFKQLGET